MHHQQAVCLDAEYASSLSPRARLWSDSELMPPSLMIPTIPNQDILGRSGCTERVFKAACETATERFVVLAGVFAAVSPHFAFKFLIDHGHQGWVMLGGVLLCVTGVEAMYADLGHFTRISVQV